MLISAHSLVHHMLWCLASGTTFIRKAFSAAPFCSALLLQYTMSVYGGKSTRLRRPLGQRENGKQQRLSDSSQAKKKRK
jgi:hypothetical protein